MPLDNNPGLYFHVADQATAKRMAELRLVYLQLAELVEAELPANRYRALALTDLEASLLRAIQGLAVAHGVRVDPWQQAQEGP